MSQSVSRRAQTSVVGPVKLNVWPSEVTIESRNVNVTSARIGPEHSHLNVVEGGFEVLESAHRIADARDNRTGISCGR
jgi:hypothetical protein